MTQKLYAYVDESGQHTRGRLFVVSTAIVLAEDEDRLRNTLLRIERDSGKDKKWAKAKSRQKRAYIEPVLRLSALHGRMFYSAFRDTTNYLPCLLHTISGAVSAVAGEEPCEASIVIDGLQKTIEDAVKTALRRTFASHIRLENVRGRKEQNDSLMRLADALAGFSRRALEEHPEDVERFRVAERRGIIRLIRA